MTFEIVCVYCSDDSRYSRSKVYPTGVKCSVCSILLFVHHNYTVYHCVAVDFTFVYGKKFLALIAIKLFA